MLDSSRGDDLGCSKSEVVGLVVDRPLVSAGRAGVCCGADWSCNFAFAEPPIFDAFTKRGRLMGSIDFDDWACVPATENTSAMSIETEAFFMDNTFWGEDSAGAKPTSESRNQLVIVNDFFRQHRTLASDLAKMPY